MTPIKNQPEQYSAKGLNRTRAWSPFLLVVAVFITGCSQAKKLSQPVGPLPEQKLLMGELNALNTAPEQNYFPLNQPGAIIAETISSSLEADGIPPVRFQIRSKGQWKNEEGKPTLELSQLEVSPDNKSMTEKIETELSKGAPARKLPLGPLSLFENKGETQGSTLRLPLEVDALGDQIQVSGTWICQQGFGEGTYGKTQWLRCKLEEGKIIQALDREERVRDRKAKLLGAFSAFRATQAPNAPKVSTEEVQLHLNAWSSLPHPTLIELKYHRTACLSASNCPLSSR